MPAEATKLSDYKNQKNSVSGKLDSISKGKKKVKSSIAAKNNEKQAIINEQSQTTKEYHAIQSKISIIAKETEVTSNQLLVAEKDLKKQKDLLEERLRVMYENSQTDYIQILVEAKSLTDLLESSRYLTIIADYDRNLLRAFESSRKELEYKKKKKEEELAKKKLEGNNKQQVISSLSVSRSDVDQELQKYNRMLQDLTNQEDELLRISEELSKKIKSLQSSGQYSGGVMRWPVPSSSNITSPYGMRMHPILHTYRMHTGIDISASSGSSIVAANKGTVIMAEWYGADGNTIIIDHGGGITTLYAHCSAFLVRVGDRVNAGETIARVGSTGWSTGPHLHFEVRVNGETKNPVNYVRG